MQPQTISEVRSELRGVVADEARVGSRLALFPALYAELTERIIEGLAGGEFEQPARLERLAVQFAQRYFNALVSFRRAERPSKSWQVAFDRAREGRMLFVQDLVLGINAHINLDLSIATAEVGGEDLDSLEGDFRKINALLEELFDRSQAVIGAHSPFLDILDRLAHDGDEVLGSFVIAKARDAAWENAKVLRSLDPRLRPAWITMLDVTASRLGQIVASPGFVTAKALALIQATEERDVRVLVEALSKVQVHMIGRS